MFVFDEMLDAEKLKTSLERLVHKEEWWKLGAQLKQNAYFLTRQLGAYAAREIRETARSQYHTALTSILSSHWVSTLQNPTSFLSREWIPLGYLATGNGLGLLPEFIRKQEHRMVCIHGSFVDGPRESAIADLAAAQLEGTVASYVSDAIGFINVLLPVKDIVEKPLSFIAESIRYAIVELGPRPQAEAFYDMIRESGAKLPPFFGDNNMHMITFTNWSKARMFELDFSVAVVSKTGEKGSENTGRPRCIQNNQFGVMLPNAFLILGKDSHGHYWLSGYMKKGYWDNIEQSLANEG
ncbi:hypothetical protein K504DRAFT_487462 [Pleomassaria siparia CBS 279.74]|uniref:Uncharacterized protein n=1 Tax=Pleomassaria siparia CBS 279.74 TaxID=1314801 RepID=A0A6G1KKL8_9PLEO|nr:hypothetical protein K504DRAFT_487462 [Pleomassaria siparia CBS 279.74]